MDDQAQTSDSELIEGCIRKDLKSWSTFVKKYSPLISASLAKRLKKSDFSYKTDLIHDMRQEIFSDIWQNGRLKALKNAQSLPYWLAIISGNHALDRLRSISRSQEDSGISIYENIGDGKLSEILESDAELPSEESACNELITAVNDALSEMPSQEKLAIKMDIFFGKKYREIAEIMRVPIGTVASYVKRGKERLRRKLKYLQ